MSQTDLGHLISRIKKADFGKLAPLLVTLAFVLILVQYSFAPLESIFYDAWVKLQPIGPSNTQKMIIITLDEESDQFLGETYPYSYSTHAKFISRLSAVNPFIINYFIPLQEPESVTEAGFQSEFHDSLKIYTERGGFFRFGTEIDQFGEVLPPEKLRDLGYLLNQIYKDQTVFSKDEVVRRAILNISGEDSLHLWTAKKIRQKNNLKEVPASAYPGIYYGREADANFALFQYLQNPVTANVKKISFHRILAGNFPKDLFQGAIVLVGSEYVSNLSDFVLTPFDKENLKTSKMSLHVQIIHALADLRTVRELPEEISQFFAVFIAVILSFFISKFQPIRGLVITVSLITGLLIFTWALFVFGGIWIKIAHLVLSIFIVYYIWVPFRAIEEYQTRFAIQEEAKILKQVDHLKQNFISLMSHDLKTPVAKIAGIVDILKLKFTNNPEQIELIENIKNSTQELNSFINSILDLTKIESQNLTLKKESKDINKLIEAISTKLDFEINAKQMTLELDLAPLYPVQIDPILMHRVLSNLIENSIKYAGQGKTITVKTWDDPDWVFIEVADNGVGIGELDLLHIFEKFYRVKNDSTHAIKGSGLGLYLVKYFIELHEGTILAESSVGRGTKFTIKLKNQ